MIPKRFDDKLPSLMKGEGLGEGWIGVPFHPTSPNPLLHKEGR
jgi:hypothetical protein